MFIYFFRCKPLLEKRRLSSAATLLANDFVNLQWVWKDSLAMDAGGGSAVDANKMILK